MKRSRSKEIQRPPTTGDDRPLRIVGVERGPGKGLTLRCTGALHQNAASSRGILVPGMAAVRVLYVRAGPQAEGNQASRDPARGPAVDVKVRGVSEREARDQRLLLTGGTVAFLARSGFADRNRSAEPSGARHRDLPAEAVRLYWAGSELGAVHLRPLGGAVHLSADTPLPFIPGLTLSGPEGQAYVTRAPDHQGAGMEPPKPTDPARLLSWLLAGDGFAGRLELFRACEAALVGMEYDARDEFFVTPAFVERVSNTLDSLAAQPGGTALERAAHALACPEQLLRTVVEHDLPKYRCRGAWIVPELDHAAQTLSPAARAVQQKIADAGMTGIGVEELGKPSTEKLVRALERMRLCRVLKNGRVVSMNAISQAHRLLSSGRGEPTGKLGPIARTLGVSRSQAEALLAILRSDGSSFSDSETTSDR